MTELTPEREPVQRLPEPTPWDEDDTATDDGEDPDE